MTKHKNKKKIREKKIKDDEIIYIHENNQNNSMSNNPNNNVDLSNELENNNKKVDNSHQSGL